MRCASPSATSGRRSGTCSGPGRSYGPRHSVSASSRRTWRADLRRRASGAGHVPADPIAEALGSLWSPLLAVTTHHQGRDNGLVAGTGVFASLVPKAPRVIIELTRSSLT